MIRHDPSRERTADPSRPRLLLGIGSGTSADGTDLALVRVTGAGGSRRVELLAAETCDFPSGLRRSIHAAATWSLSDAASMHFELGRLFGSAAREFLGRHGVEASSITVAGSHGQTVLHHDGDPREGTLQLGDVAVTASQLGCPVVGDFRWSDLAAGGQGAPISPFADWVLHRHAAPRLAILNLGGIANVTLLEGEALPRAWDAGPANGPLDALASAELGTDFDRDGRAAAAGRPIPALLEQLRADPFFERPLPRSTGLERFGRSLVERARAAAPDASVSDLLASFVELAAWAVADSLARAGWAGGPVFVCGGGAHNGALRAALERSLKEGWPQDAALRDYSELGWDADRREAVAFALLADAWWLGEESAWPATTGAARAVRLGRLVLP